MSQAGIANAGAVPPPPGSVTDLKGQDGVTVPPNASGIINVNGTVVAAGSTPFTTTGNAGTNTETWNIQLSQAIGASDATKVGVSAFDSSKFSVDANGFVSLLAGADLHVTPFIVSAAGGSNGANFTTIQAAVNAANAAGGGIVVVQPGTYTENLNLFSGVHIMGLQFADAGGGVVINGTHIPPTSGGFAIQYVSLIGATGIFSSAAAGSAHLVLANALVNITNGYTFNLPNWTGKLESFDVNAAVGTADGYVNNSGGSEVDIFECSVGSGTSNVMTVSGFNLFAGANIYCPINFSGSSTAQCDYSDFNQPLTFSGSSSGELSSARIATGASAAITMNSSGNWTITNSTILSTNSPAIAGIGVGTLKYAGLVFINNSAFSGSLTLATPSWQPYSRAIAGSDGTKVGTAAFNSADFTVDTNGFVSLKGGGFTWIDQASSITLSKNTGYFVTAATTQTLPASPSQGDTVKIVCDTAGAVVVTANTGQTIRLSSSASSSGGTFTNTARGDSLELFYRAATTQWMALNAVGNWTIA